MKGQYVAYKAKTFVRETGVECLEITMGYVAELDGGSDRDRIYASEHEEFHTKDKGLIPQLLVLWDAGELEQGVRTIERASFIVTEDTPEKRTVEVRTPLGQTWLENLATAIVKRGRV